MKYLELTYDPPKLTKWQAFWQITWKNFWGSKVGKWLSVGLTVVATFLAVLCPAFVPYYLTALIGTTVSLLGGGIIAGSGHKHNFWSGFAEFVSQEWEPSFAISMSLAMLSFGVSQVAQAIKNAKTHSIFRDIKLDFNSGNSLELHFVKHGKSMGFKNADAYLKGARKFLDGSKSIKVQSFISAQGTYFQYNPITNEFGIINKFGGIYIFFAKDWV